ncbi:MAG: cell division protein FtsZ [Deltaproteobacteria bacterium]|nr:cell division protein FtsZ [Deltaproteobacteria bacterium]
MSELIEKKSPGGASIKVLGIGGGGGNAINTMIEGKLDRVEFVAANTDVQALRASLAKTKIQLGRDLTKGLGAGANPEVGRRAAIESEEEITEMLQGCDLVFLTAGMGGGTGTGAIPVIARIAKDLGALTIAVVTKPFSVEGKRRLRYAEQGLDELREIVDTLITIPNERLLVVAGKEMPMLEAFHKADEVLLHAVQGISDLILVKGLINLDFADVRTVMAEKGIALMGSGVASGEHRAIDAATRAISSPLLENLSMTGATGILLNVTGGKTLTLHEVNEAAKLIQEEAHPEANIIFGAVIEESMKESIRVTVIATGFEKNGPVVGSSFTAYQKRNDWMPRPAMAESLVSPSTKAASEEGSQLHRNRAKVPIKTDLKKMLQDLGPEVFVPDPDGDEYDIPTFLRKHAD